MTQRNYRIVGLSSQKTVIVEWDGNEIDTDVKPEEWGLFGLEPAEQKILLRGMTPKQRRELR